VLTDPYDESIGYSLGEPKANIVTSSHPHPGHGFTSGVGGEPRIVHGPGEYEIAGIFITGISTFHDSTKGRERGKNTVYLIEMDDMRLCHLGDLGHPLTTEQAEDIDGVDVMLVPVGGLSTIDAATAVETVRLLQPRIVILPQGNGDKGRVIASAKALRNQDRLIRGDPGGGFRLPGLGSRWSE
jgi:L-ascorbate metabolism protein UlaG (beta-lactamase superfamily)